MAVTTTLPPLTFDRHVVTLRLRAAVRFHFFHGGALKGALCQALGMPTLPPGVVPFACESGRVSFAAGEDYRLGLTLIGPRRPATGRSGRAPNPAGQLRRTVHRSRARATH